MTIISANPHIPPNQDGAKPPPFHHSWADWDFSNGLMFLATDEFVSPPSSVKRSSWASPYTTTTLCKHASVLNVPYGQLQGYFRRSGINTLWIHFRSQQDPGVADYADSYFLWLAAYGTTGYRSSPPYNAGLYPAYDYTMPSNVWVPIRISWYYGIDLYCYQGLNVKLEVWESGTWVDKGTAADPDNMWAASGKGRIGFTFNRGDNWADDIIVRRAV